MLNTVLIPEGVTDIRIRRGLLEGFGIEIGGGLGELAGKVWRVGLMGHSCTRRNVWLFLSALETIIAAEGFRPKGDARESAAAIYAASDESE